MIKSTYAIFDLDGTIANCKHREHLAQAKQWDEFHALCLKDEPILPIVDLLKACSVRAKIVLMTGRNERYREWTMDWIFEKDLATYVHDLQMRPDDDFSKDIDLKLNMIDVYFGGRPRALEKVWLIVEDRDVVVNGLRDAGFCVLQPVASGY